MGPLLSSSLRILAVSRMYHGRNDYSFVRAFRRAGHSVLAESIDCFFPVWEQLGLRVLKRMLTPVLVGEFNRALIRQATHLRPDLFFVFKGQYVTPTTLAAIKATGAIAINFFPDTGFADDGRYLPKTIGQYDWVFTTKPAGVQDLAENYGFANATFLPHAFDPEAHHPVRLDDQDRERFECDVCFVGFPTPKKQRILSEIHTRLPDIKMRIWGPRTWRTVRGLATVYQGAPVWGTEYAKAILASKITLGLLSEGGPSAPFGDVITARTFEIPGAGGFMLHERTEEALHYFEEETECAYFSDTEDLVGKIRYYLDRPDERTGIAATGRQRALSSGYSVDDRIATVLDKYAELRRTQLAADHRAPGSL